MDSERVSLLLGCCQGCLNVNLDKEEENMDMLNKRKEERVDTSRVSSLSIFHAAALAFCSFSQPPLHAKLTSLFMVLFCT